MVKVDWHERVKLAILHHSLIIVSRSSFSEIRLVDNLYENLFANMSDKNPCSWGDLKQMDLIWICIILLLISALAVVTGLHP